MVDLISLFKGDEFNASKILEVDIHSHLIPNIDDGPATLTEAISLVREFQDLGYKRLILTPHTMVGLYNNSRDSILREFCRFRKEIYSNGLSIDLDISSEYYLDENFFKLLTKREVIPVSGEYILFETSYTTRPLNLKEVVYEIYTQGYKPILAHPERYIYLRSFEKEFLELKKLNIYFQVDANSLIGLYGKGAQRRANYLLESGLIDFIGSDVHNKRQLKRLKIILNSKKIWDKILLKNNLLNSSLIEKRSLNVI